MNIMASEYKDRLVSAREAAGKTQAQVADHIGMKQPSYSDLETGKSNSSTKNAQIADFLGVNALWLATGEGTRDGDVVTGKFPTDEEILAKLSASDIVELLTHKKLSKKATANLAKILIDQLLD